MANENTGEVSLIPVVHPSEREPLSRGPVDDTDDEGDEVQFCFGHISISPHHSSIFAKQLAPLLQELWRCFLCYRWGCANSAAKEEDIRKSHSGCPRSSNPARVSEKGRPWCRVCSNELYSLTRSVFVYGSQSTTDRRSLFIHLAKATGQTLVQYVDFASPFCCGDRCSVSFSLVDLHHRWGVRDVLNIDDVRQGYSGPHRTRQSQTQGRLWVPPKRERLSNGENVSQRILCAIKQAEAPRSLCTFAEREDHTLRSTLVLTFFISRHSHGAVELTADGATLWGHKHCHRERRREGSVEEARINIILLPDSVAAARGRRDAEESRSLARVLQACGGWRKKVEEGEDPASAGAVHGREPGRVGSVSADRFGGEVQRPHSEVTSVSLCASPLLSHLFYTTAHYICHVGKGLYSSDLHNPEAKRVGTGNCAGCIGGAERHSPGVSSHCSSCNSSLFGSCGSSIAVDCVDASLGKSIVVCCVNSGLDHRPQVRQALFFVHRATAGGKSQGATPCERKSFENSGSISEVRQYFQKKKVERENVFSCEHGMRQSPERRSAPIPQPNDTTKPVCRELGERPTDFAPSPGDAGASSDRICSKSKHCCENHVELGSPSSEPPQTTHTATGMHRLHKRTVFGGYDGYQTYNFPHVNHDQSDKDCSSHGFLFDVDKNMSAHSRVVEEAASKGNQLSGLSRGCTRFCTPGNAHSPLTPHARHMPGESSTYNCSAARAALLGEGHTEEEEEKKRPCGNVAQLPRSQVSASEGLNISGGLVGWAKGSHEHCKGPASAMKRTDELAHAYWDLIEAEVETHDSIDHYVRHHVVAPPRTSSSPEPQREVPLWKEGRVEEDRKSLGMPEKLLLRKKNVDKSTTTAATSTEQRVEKIINKMEVQLLLLGYRLFLSGLSEDADPVYVAESRDLTRDEGSAHASNHTGVHLPKHLFDTLASNPAQQPGTLGKSESYRVAGKTTFEQSLCWKCLAHRHTRKDDAYRRFLDVLQALCGRITPEGWLDRTSPFAEEEQEERMGTGELSRNLPFSVSSMEQRESSLLLQASKLTTALHQRRTHKQQVIHDDACMQIAELQEELRREREQRRKLQEELAELRFRTSKYKAKLSFIDSTLKPMVTNGIKELEAMISERKRMRRSSREGGRSGDGIEP